MDTLVRIKYITSYSVEYICHGQCGSGVWRNPKGDIINNIDPMEFENETDAKLFLVKHKYDLPPLRVIFEPVVREEAPQVTAAPESEQWVVLAYNSLDVVSGVFGPFDNFKAACAWFTKNQGLYGGETVMKSLTSP